MKMTYFADTDTLDIVMGDKRVPVDYTADGPDENVLLYYKDGRLVGLTLEHASETTLLNDLRKSPHFETHGEELASMSN